MWPTGVPSHLKPLRQQGSKVISKKILNFGVEERIFWNFMFSRV